jgi:DNA-binding ferritin-like protein
VKNLFYKFFYANLDKLLDTFIAFATKLDALAERQLKLAEEELAKANKLVADANVKRTEAAKASRISGRFKEIVS